MNSSLSWFASDTLKAFWDCFLSAGSSSGDIWPRANVRCAITPTLCRITKSSFPAVSMASDCFLVVNRRFYPFVVGLTQSTGLHMHTLEHAWAYHDALRGPDMLCGSWFSCFCESSALLYLCLRMSFPSATESSGLPLYPLCITARLCLLGGKKGSICPQEVSYSFTYPLLSLENAGAPSLYQ